MLAYARSMTKRLFPRDSFPGLVDAIQKEELSAPKVRE